MALADGRSSSRSSTSACSGSAYGYEPLDRVDVRRARQGRARRARRRDRHAALDAAAARRPIFGCATVADGVVFTSTFDGTVYGFDTRDGLDALDGRSCAPASTPARRSPATLLLVGAGVPKRGGVLELAAFGTGGSS